jgi:predicted helicase
MTVAAHRPFVKQHVYFDKQMNAMTYQLNRIFPEPGIRTPGIAVLSPRPGTAFAVLMVDDLPDLSMFTYTAQFFPRFTFEPKTADSNQLSGIPEEAEESGKQDNISGTVLEDYQTSYGASVTSDDLFYYVYAILHSPIYREMFGSDIQRMIPRIPKVKDFTAFVQAGKMLSDLHLNYETVAAYPLQVSDGSDFKVDKMRYAKVGRVTDKSTIIYNSSIRISGIPESAHDYMIGSRSALDWIIERYQLKTDKDSGIVNDPNDWLAEKGNERALIDLIERIVTVSVETMRIVNSLPALDLLESQSQAG